MRKFIAVISILALILLASCRTQRIIVTQPPDTIRTHDTVRLVTRATDTVCRIDSVWIMQSPDTTLIRVSRSTERIRTRTDTVRILRVDTVIKSIPLDKNTIRAINISSDANRKKSVWSSIGSAAALLLTLISLAVIIILAARLIRKFIADLKK